MNMFFFFWSDFCGGAERRLLRIFNNISKNTNNFDIIIIGKSDKINDFLEEYIGELFLNIIVCSNIFHAIYIMMKNKYKIIFHFDVGLKKIPLIIISKLIKSKNILTIADIKLAELKLYSNKEKISLRILSRLANHIDILYPSKLNNFKEYYKVKNITYTPGSFTNLEEYKPLDKSNIIVFSSRLIEEKNPLLALKAVNLCKNELRNNKYKILICGNGQELQSLVEYVKINDLDDLVDFKGYINAKTILPNARVFLSLQKNENYPSQSLLESISSGCYIIASDVGDTKLIVKNDFGKTVDLNEVDICKEIVKYLNYSEEEKNQIVINSRRFAEENFHIKKSVKYFNLLISNYS